MSSISGRAHAARPSRSPLARLFDRQLQHYPDTPARMTYLAVTVLATIVLYYELYVQGAVSTTDHPALRILASPGSCSYR